MTETENSPSDSRRFADDLIPNTIARAFEIDFYKRHWDGIPINSIVATHTLARLPLLTKSMAVEMLSSFSYHERPALVSHTSGTSTGKITTRCRSLAEVQAIWNVRSRSLPRDPLGLIPLTISVDGANHGQMIPVPSVEFGLKAVGFDHAVIDHVKQQIIRTYSFPGVTSRVKAIDAPLGFIKLLTCNLIASGIDPKEIGLELLSTYGEFVTSEWSHRLENLWGAMHSDLYATSETVGGARRCNHCGWYKA